MNRVVDFVPEDMTTTVEGGMTLTELQVELARQGSGFQWTRLVRIGSRSVLCSPPMPASATIRLRHVRDC